MKSETLSSPKILYVEDNPADADLMKQALEAQGEPFSLTVVEDGQTVLDLLRLNNSFLPHVIVLDLELRGIDGLTILGALKAEPGWQNVPVMVFVAPHDPNELKAEMLSADLCLAKPMDWSAWPELIRIVRGLSNFQKTHRATGSACAPIHSPPERNLRLN